MGHTFMVPKMGVQHKGLKLFFRRELMARNSRGLTIFCFASSGRFRVSFERSWSTTLWFFASFILFILKVRNIYKISEFLPISLLT